jgi:lactoylglutathione lyase
MDQLDDTQNVGKSQFRFAHNNFNVVDLEKSLAFYREALGLQVLRRREGADFTIVFMGDNEGGHQLELTWLKNFGKPSYNLGDNEFHLAFTTDDYRAAHTLHEKMGCICYENKGMGIYFIADPDGYWLEIIPKR